VGTYNAVGYLVKQTKNEQGQWVALEKPIDYFCGTYKRQLVIEPGQVLIAKRLRYQGDQRVECRLKFSKWRRTVYSNTFLDNVPKSQLSTKLTSR